MKLLIDTNVVLDVLLRREPFFRTAAEVLSLTQRDEVREYVSASAITDIYYIANKQMKDRDAVRDLLKRLLMVVSVAAVSEREIQNALNLAWGDFEDSVQYSVALLNEMDGIVTRNPSDYQEANMRIWLPEQALELFANEGS
ncbi:PIN domain-containing protein [Pseudoflavonifractor sp. 60]|uniref:PIN domain-containing protein n=1 Tax=Pseudoflavonifractor sp. 60 TaxID=2304576 RepID=UPI00136E0841|nr:PIN domain-containing protein [Pseudoflavonifractor sp. 60]NBI69034.1 PIN domain-containing protein [Pseudoflavonifractor sp. 60]